MFRRKEESATEFSAEESTAHAVNDAAPAAQENAPATAPTAATPASYAPASPISYAPAPRAAEAARPVQAQASYRPAQPTLAAEFNRSSGIAARSVAANAETTTRSAAASATSHTSAHTSHTSSPAADKLASIKPNRRVLTVGNDILLKGEIATCDRLLIEGRVEAKLSDVHTVEIAECGSFKGTAEVEDAEISGVFEGDLIVRNRLVIYASGEVRGNIGYGEVEIERGGKLTGQIKTVAAATKAAAPVAATDNKARSLKEAVAA